MKLTNHSILSFSLSCNKNTFQIECAESFNAYCLIVYNSRRVGRFAYINFIMLGI